MLFSPQLLSEHKTLPPQNFTSIQPGTAQNSRSTNLPKIQIIFYRGQLSSIRATTSDEEEQNFKLQTVNNSEDVQLHLEAKKRKTSNAW